MPIHYLHGDIFTSPAQTIVNPVNCKGHMGKGLALAFKQRYPAMFATYQQECRDGTLHLGQPRLYRESTPWILNFPTKDHWRSPSHLSDIEQGLATFVSTYQHEGITSIAFPKLGAGLGGLSWDQVGPLMARYLQALEIDVWIYIEETDSKFTMRFE